MSYQQCYPPSQTLHSYGLEKRLPNHAPEDRQTCVPPPLMRKMEVTETYTHMHTHTHTYTHIHNNTCMYTHIRAHINTHAQAHTKRTQHTYMRTHTHIHNTCMYTHKHKHAHINAHAQAHTNAHNIHTICTHISPHTPHPTSSELVSPFQSQPGIEVELCHTSPLTETLVVTTERAISPWMPVT